MKRQTRSAAPVSRHRRGRVLGLPRREVPALTEVEADFERELQVAFTKVSGAAPPNASPSSVDARVREWLTQHPEKVTGWVEVTRRLILDVGRRHGIKNAEDLPTPVRGLLHEAALTLAGSLFKDVNDRLGGHLNRCKKAEQIAILEQAADDMNRVVDYLLDAQEPERSQWLAFVEPLRADCTRVAQKLRRPR